MKDQKLYAIARTFIDRKLVVVERKFKVDFKIDGFNSEPFCFIRDNLKFYLSAKEAIWGFMNDCHHDIERINDSMDDLSIKRDKCKRNLEDIRELDR